MIFRTLDTLIYRLYLRVRYRRKRKEILERFMREVREAQRYEDARINAQIEWVNDKTGTLRYPNYPGWRPR